MIDLGLEDVHKPRILVADDEAAVQSLVFDSLSSHYTIISSPNGRDALTKATNNQPELILMDVMMPDMGGYEAIRALQDNPKTRTIPVLVFTAQDFDNSTVEMIRREPNVVGFVRKPFKPKGLRETIRMAIEKRHGTSS